MNETELDSVSTAAQVSTLSPQQIARAYDRFVSARWRGEDEAADTVATWFEAHWVSQPLPEPDDPPAGASVLGGSGRGIRWYARDDEVYGHVPGYKAGYYRVAVAETVPSIPAPWDAQPGPLAKTDSMLHVAAHSQVENRTPRGAPPADCPAADRVLEQIPARD